jgi:hypothetical protein
LETSRLVLLVSFNRTSNDAKFLYGTDDCLFRPSQ